MGFSRSQRLGRTGGNPANQRSSGRCDRKPPLDSLLQGSGCRSPTRTVDDGGRYSRRRRSIRCCWRGERRTGSRRRTSRAVMTAPAMPRTTAAAPGSLAAATTPSNRPRNAPAAENGPAPAPGVAFAMSAVITETASQTITAAYATRRPCRVLLLEAGLVDRTETTVIRRRRQSSASSSPSSQSGSPRPGLTVSCARVGSTGTRPARRTGASSWPGSSAKLSGRGRT